MQESKMVDSCTQFRPRYSITCAAPVPSREKFKWTLTTTFCNIHSAILSPFRLILSFQVVAEDVSCRSCAYIPHAFRNWQYQRYRDAVHIAGFKKALCIGNCTPTGWSRSKSYFSKQYCSNTEVLSSESALEGFSLSSGNGIWWIITNTSEIMW